MSLIRVDKSRGKTFGITIKDAAGNVITPTGSDLVRIIIGYQGRLGANNANAKLVLVSGSPSAAGSSITAGAENTVRLDATDLSFDPGVYTMFVDYFDADDADEWKLVSKQVFHLRDT